jgi:hypothetical protein
MNKIILAIAIATIGSSAIAADARQGQLAGANAGSDATALVVIDNSQNVPETQRVETYQKISSGTTTIKNVPTVYAPSLTSSNDTCMGSSSVGASGVGFGVSFGTSWTDANCIMLKNSRELFNMGMPDVAFARLCMDTLNREAIELTGKVCPQTKKEEAAKAAAAAQAQ